MNKALWQYLQIEETKDPDLTCPICNRGKLTLEKENLKYLETEESKSLKQHDDYDFEWIGYRFIAILICSNSHCLEIVSTTGIGGVEFHPQIDYDGNDYSEYRAYFIPKYFEPSIKIIDTKDEYGKAINELLTESFSVFFLNSSLCANKIRQVVEQILNEFKIKKFTINKQKKRVVINVTQRIHLFQSKFNQHSDIAQNLLAIKWIGNIGSHQNNVDRSQTLDAYEILQHCLDELFLNRTKAKIINKLSKTIIKNKGKQKKAKFRF